MSMLYKVKYISNRSSQTDDFANKPHESVAKSLMTILQQHDEIKHPVIGIEGTWGSGKSQVINILQKIIREQSNGKRYIFHTYDIWSVQEDLTRRSFLDSILNYAISEDGSIGFKDDKCNKENLEKLNATTTIHSTKTFPLVRLFFGIALLIPIAIFLITMVEKAFGYNENASITYQQLQGWTGLILFSIALVLFVKDFFSEYRDAKREDVYGKKTECDLIKTSLSRILYLYKGKDIEKEDHETIIKDEPSVSRFKKIFGDLKTSIKDDTVLIVVFDNMDRLSDRSKLMSVWTLLHTFFTEGDNGGKIWAIVPYDKEQLTAIMAPDENIMEKKDIVATAFLNKTFFTSIHIPEPIMTSWKLFLDEKLDEAFRPTIDAEDKNVVSLIFSRTQKGMMRPRDIIAFVNRLVTLYIQHQFEEIPLPVLAVYSQFESEFREDATNAILNHSGFEAFLPLFNSRTVLTKQLASVYYNVKSEDALEVVLGGAITRFLSTDLETNKEFDDEFLKLSSNQAFGAYIEEYFNNQELVWETLKAENLFYLLQRNEISLKTRTRIYVQVTEKVESVYKTDFSAYAPWMEWAFLNCDIQNTNKLICSILKLSYDVFDEYQNSVIELLLLSKQRSKLIVKPKMREVHTVDEMRAFIDNLKQKDIIGLFRKCVIYITQEKILEYITEGVSAPELNAKTENVYDMLRLLVKYNYPVSKINDYIVNVNISIDSYPLGEVERIYRVFDIINPVIRSVPSYTSYSADFKSIPEYYAACIYTVRNSSSDVQRGCFNAEYEKDTFIPILSRYVSLSELLKMAISCQAEEAKKMCNNLLNNSGMRLGDIVYYLTHFTSIVNLLEEPNKEALINKLDQHCNAFPDIDISDLDDYWIENLTKDVIERHLVFKTISEKLKSAVEHLTMEQWTSIVSESSPKLAITIIHLEENGLLSDIIWKKPELCDVMQDVYCNYVVNNDSLNIDIFDIWKKHSDDSILAVLANHTKDHITTPSIIEIERFIQFVLLYIKHSKRITDPNLADCFFDDYLLRLYRECPLEYIVQKTIENQIRLLAFIRLCSEDRRGNLKTILSSKYDELAENAPAREKLKSIIDAI